MRRDDVVIARLDALVSLMQDWASWQKGYRMKLGYPTRSTMVASDAGSDFEGMCDAIDSQTMRTIDSVVDDIGQAHPAQKAALLRRYGVAAVFRFPRNNYEQCLVEAHEALIEQLPKKGVIVF